MTQLCIRVAIFILYLHIFEGRAWFRVACYISIAIIITGNLVIFLLLAFQCKPIETIWNKFIVGQCLDVVGVTYATGAFAITWDIVLVVLPIPEVRRLQISVRERVMLLLLFGFAALSSVASIIRLKFVVQFNTTFDPTCEWQWRRGGKRPPVPSRLTRSNYQGTTWTSPCGR